MALLLPDASEREIGEVLHLGKAHVTPPEQMWMSPVQAIVDGRVPGKHTLMACGKVPIRYEPQGESAENLESGEWRELRDGAAFCLMASSPERTRVHYRSGPPQAKEPPLRPIFLLLCGPQGSGKTTFASKVAEGSEAWATTSQDHEAQADSKRRRHLCLQRAGQLAAKGKNVIVDNTHLTPEQRRDYVELATNKLKCDCQAVSFTTPIDTCMHRVKRRKCHPSGVHGEQGLTVFRDGRCPHLQQPSHREGFSRVFQVHHPEEADEKAAAFASIPAPREAAQWIHGTPGDKGGKRVESTDAGLYALRRCAQHPEAGEKVHWFDEQVVVLDDKFPKGMIHILVLVRDQDLEGPSSLTSESAHLVERMLSVAEEETRKRARELRETRGTTPPPMRYGFHSIPSMPQLHMHAISQDLRGSGMRKKQHWNSFASKFFVDARSVIESLRSNGSVPLPENPRALLKQELTCNRSGCSKVFPSLPSLLSHLDECKFPPPGEW